MNCPNCQNKYTHTDYLPKILVKCGHTFCIKCLENIQQSKDNEIESYIKCPNCNEETVINDIQNLPKNMALLDNTQIKANSPKKAPNKIICPIHSKDIEAFCENDKTMLCVSCIIENGHKNHDLSSIEKAAQKERAVFEKGFSNALLMEKDLLETLSEIEEIKNKLIINTENNIEGIEQFYSAIREVLSERESLLKTKIETVLDNEIEFFQTNIDKISEQMNLITAMKSEKDNYESFSEFEILKKSKENNENLKNALNKPPKLNREVVFYDLKKDEELTQIKKLLTNRFSEESMNNSIANSNTRDNATIGLYSKKSLNNNVTSNYLTNEIKKIEKKTKQLVETKSNININPRNLNAARDTLKAQRKATIPGIHATQIITNTNPIIKAATTTIKDINNTYFSNLNNSNKTKSTTNIGGANPQKRNKTPNKFDVDNNPNSSTFKNETVSNTNITTNVSNYDQLQEKPDTFNFVGKTSEKEPQVNQQKTLALFPALKIKVSGNKVNLNKSDIVINDMEAKYGEASPSFRKEEEKMSFQEKHMNLINETNLLSSNNRNFDDETIKLDITSKNAKDENLFDSQININLGNTSQLMSCTQSIHTDLASLYKTMNYSIILLGGKPDGVVRRLEIENKVWKEIKNMNIERSDFCAIMYKEKKILLIGGKIGETVSDTIDLFNIEDSVIKTIDLKLKSPRCNFGSVYIQSKLFVAGGFTGKETLGSFAYFDKKSKNWNELQRMLVKRKDFMLIVGVDNSLYAIGGSDERDLVLKSVERHELDKNSWRKIEEMSQARKHYVAVTMPDGIYVFGGNDGCQYLKSVEKYDFLSKKWRYLQDMYFPRSHFACVASNDCRYIYAIGGYDGKPLNSIERYDVTLNKWEVMNKMNNFKYKHQAVFICE